MNRTGEHRGAGTDEIAERDHELRSSLYGIEAAALALNEQRDRVPSGEVDQLVLAIASEARRLRLLLAPHAKQCTSFDLAEAIGPAILMTRALGVVVRDAVPSGMYVHGCRDDLAEVAFALLDNARVHASPSIVDVRATTARGTTTLYVEDRGPGIGRIGRKPLFRRGSPGAESSGSGLGLFIAHRLMIDQRGSLSAHQRSGGGASFALCLPSAPSDASGPLPRVAPYQAAVR